MRATYHRLRTKKDFDHVLKKGASISSPLFVIKWNTSPTKSEGPRVGIIVSNKISKSAVKRNSARRKIREALKILLPDLPRNTDIVVLTKTAILSATYNDIMNQLEKFSRRLQQPTTHKK